MERAQPLIGRAAEMSKLRDALGSATRGRGTVVTVSGEPGIGKTRLLEELDQAAAEAGAGVAWGHAYEQGGAPPFWPWVEMLRGCISELDVAELRELFAGERAPVGDLLPELIDGELDLPARPEEPNTDEARWLLFEGFAAALRHLASERPLVVLIEDVQWADSASLLLLRHLAQRIGSSRVLLVATYRDEELAPNQPLSQALRAISRAESNLRLELTGLRADEIQRYLERAGVSRADLQMSQEVTERTAGNPFFLREVVSLMERAPSPGEALTQVPTAILEALEGRLSRLSEPLSELLAHVAVMGREFRLTELESPEAAGNEPPPAALIEEALAARVLSEPSTGRYRFVHALMRDAVLERLSATRRAALHGEVGLALERHRGDRGGDQGAAELAQHFLEAAQIDSRFGERALRQSMLAAEQAHAALAWEAAANRYDDCVGLLDSGVVTGNRAEILMRRGECRRTARRDQEAWRDLLTAATEFHRAGDSRGQAQATIEAIRVWAPPQRKREMLGAALEAEDLTPDLRALLLAKRARLNGLDGADDLARAAKLGGTSPGTELSAEILVVAGRILFLEGRFEEAAPKFRAASDLFDDLGQYEDAVRLLGDEHDCYLIGGDYRRAMDDYADMVAYARRRRQRLWEHIWLGDWGAFALMRGDVARAFECISETRPDVSYTYYTTPIGIAEYSGVAPPGPFVAPVAIAGGVPGLVRPVHALRARALMFMNDLDAAREEVVQWATLHERDSEIGHGGAICDGMLQRLGTQQMIADYYELLNRWPAAHASVSGSLDRLRGSLALRLGRLDEASDHLEYGLAWCDEQGCVVEAARCRRELGELFARRGESRRALEQLTAAIEVFAEHGANGYKEEAREYLETLKQNQRSGADELSEREREVVTLVAGGRTNREIADELTISHYTAANHVKNILAKTGAANRAEAAAYALSRGLIEPHPGDSDSTSA